MKTSGLGILVNLTSILSLEVILKVFGFASLKQNFFKCSWMYLNLILSVLSIKIYPNFANLPDLICDSTDRIVKISVNKVKNTISCVLCYAMQCISKILRVSSVSPHF